MPEKRGGGIGFCGLGYAGGKAKIARVHQYGLNDRPSRNTQPVRDTRRELLGFSADDQRWIMEKIVEKLHPNT